MIRAGIGAGSAAEGGDGAGTGLSGRERLQAAGDAVGGAVKYAQ